MTSAFILLPIVLYQSFFVFFSVELGGKEESFSKPRAGQIDVIVSAH